jgi:hypothetical protein
MSDDDFAAWFDRLKQWADVVVAGVVTFLGIMFWRSGDYALAAGYAVMLVLVLAFFVRRARRIKRREAAKRD